MINLLEGEEVIADLRQGSVQRLSDDLFLKKTIILTNKRLILVRKKFGAFEKQYIFLKDVSSLISIRKYNLQILLGIIILVTLSVLSINGGNISVGSLFAVVALTSVIALWDHKIVVSTGTMNIFYTLEKRFDTKLADHFIEICQVEINKYKNV
jgi:hypothetical protein